jgi:2-polyprenyl-6-methoxyphenol hydroxylase-like FAD-dependent oxidoreductase
MAQEKKFDVGVAVIGGGPAGMAIALGCIKAGIDVKVFERYPYARPAGNILNLWPPAIHALQCMGVKTSDLGACSNPTTFRNTSGHLRATVRLADDIVEKYDGGFLGLLRPDLYKRMLSSIPEGIMEFNRSVTAFEDTGDSVRLTLADGNIIKAAVVIGADGIDSSVRTHLWGQSPRRAHNLHVIGGFTFDIADGVIPGECVLSHDIQYQGTYGPLMSQGRKGLQWWFVEAWPDEKPVEDNLKDRAQMLATKFPGPLSDLVRSTRPEDVVMWPIRDRVPLKKWSKGRMSLAGDAAHATSPYAAYGAGMSISDGYFIAQSLYKVDLADTKAVAAALERYEACQLEHTTHMVESAHFIGKLFHHVPFPLNYLRNFVLDWTPLLQRQVGDKNPDEITGQLRVMGKSITEA